MDNNLQLPDDPTCTAHEPIISSKWKRDKVYYQIKEQEKKFKLYFFFTDGPPFVSSNVLHCGHISIGDYKDLIQKHKHKMGFECSNELGLDTHGLPIETVVSNLLGVKTKSDIYDMGIAKFNNACKETITSFSGSWEPIFDAIGRMADFKKVYKTMDLNFMETVWWCFSELWKKNLVYKSYNVMPYSYGCQTPLSNFEAKQNYKEVDTKSVYVWFQLIDNPNRGMVAWSTTPWTLPSNLALCVNKDIMYVVCLDENGKEYIVAESSVNNLGIKFVSVTPLGKGSMLVGLRYIPVFDFFVNADKNYHQVISDDYVKEGDGTGIVHIAPAFGEDDCRVCVQNKIIDMKNLDKVCPVDDEGCFTDIVKKYHKILVFDANSEIIIDLKKRKLIVKTEQIKHQYPHCYRTDTPLIYRAASSFFIDVPQIKDDMIRLNKKVNWHPKPIGENRFANWLEDARPWCVSRDRFFGTPLPVWISDDETEMLCIGSIDELMKYQTNLDERPKDLHPEYINEVILKSPTTGNLLKRVPYIFDCWFESGSVPFGQIHYPFENKNYFDDKEYLSDFIVEGLDQTRGWFYTLLVLSTAILNKAPFKNVVCTGLVMDENGLKFSKKYGNFSNPNELIKTYGADCLRLYMLGSPLVNAEPLKFSNKEIDKCKKRIIPYVNGVKFFLEHYMNYKKENKTEIKYFETQCEGLNIIDKWFLERTYQLRLTVIQNLEDYHVDKAIYNCLEYIEDLTNWYIKFNRDRLKGLSGVSEWRLSLSVLYTTIMDYVVLCAPMMPFLSEHLYDHLRKINEDVFPETSVHLRSYPTSIHQYNMTHNFKQVQMIAQNIRSVRDSSVKHTSIKTPIKKCTIYHKNESYLENLRPIIDIVQDEVNCIDFSFELLDDSMNNYKIKFNNKAMGQKFKKDAAGIRNALEKMEISSQDELSKFYRDEEYILTVNVTTQNYLISRDEMEVIQVRKNNDNPNVKYSENEGVLVSLDMTYDVETHDIYQVRKLMAFIQNIRKQMGLRPWNKVSLHVDTNSPSNVIETLRNYDLMINSRLGASFVPTEKITSPINYDWENFDETNNIILIGVNVVDEN